jgi:hypothetical protein
MTTTTAQTVADLNDRFRAGTPGSNIPGRKFMTRGLSALPLAAQILIWAKVAAFADFTEDNDPYGEHDFGAFEFPGAGRIFWKIDCYADSTMKWGSEAPHDPERSFRVLTVMLAEEY